MKTILLTTALLAFPLSFGCSKADDGPAKTPKPAVTAPTAPGATQGNAPGAAAAIPSADGTSGSGTVLETMDSGGYSYAKVDLGAGKEAWIAGPQTTVKVGAQVSYTDGAPMPGYHSKTLNRTFEMIYFVQAIQPAGAAPAGAATAPAGHGAAPAAGHGDAPAAAAAAVPVKIENIKKADGGKTVAEVISAPAALAGKEVALRGVVVKYNGGIMGKNWLHVQDGSGAEGANDLTITTDATATVGDTVLIRGKVATDKDFGAGYKYAVIIEDATVTVE